jgi:hypothetical protein
MEGAAILTSASELVTQPMWGAKALAQSPGTRHLLELNSVATPRESPLAGFFLAARKLPRFSKSDEAERKAF